MPSKKTLLLATGSALAVGAIIGTIVQFTSAYGNVVASAPVAVVEEGTEVVMVTHPTQKQLNQLNKLLESNPELSKDTHAYRQVFEANVIGLDAEKQQQDKSSKHQEVKFRDEGTGEEYVLDLLSYQGEKGPVVFAEPGSTTPRLLKNPKDASQLLFEKNFGLYLLDTNTMQVKSIGDHKARMKLFEKTMMWIANGQSESSDDRTLFWSEEPVWSRDGTKIAFISNRDMVETDRPATLTLWVHDLATGMETQVSGTDLQGTRPFAWTADGSILYHEYVWLNKQPHSTITLVNPATKKKQRLADGELLAISDDAQTAFYAQGEGDKMKLFALQLATGESKLVRSFEPGDVLHTYTADFSADGTRVVTMIHSMGGVQWLLVYNLQTGTTSRLELPRGKQLSTDVVFAGDQLVVSLNDLQDMESETVLMKVE